MYIQSFSIFTIGHFFHFLLVLFVRFFERDMIDTSNGTISNMKQANIVHTIKNCLPFVDTSALQPYSQSHDLPVDILVEGKEQSANQKQECLVCVLA